MQLKQYLETLYDYNYWANHRYLEVAETLTEEQLFQKQGHSWDNVHTVFMHMMNSENWWLQRWNGISTRPAFTREEFPTLASLRDHWTGLETDIRSYVASQTDESLLRMVTYKNPKGESFTVPLWNMMAHLPNHNTHHRGELAAMFALMNVSHPEEEVIQYFLNLSGQKKF
jgi:uncharacterized damage-inducible protein DinB